MRPVNTFDNVMYGNLRDAIFSGYGSLIFAVGTSLTDVQNVLFSQFAAWVVRAFAKLYIITNVLWQHITTLPISVVHIFSMGAKPEVVRTNARGIVTAVEDMLSLWYGAISNHPRQAMCSILNSMYADLSVALNMSRSHPFPTTIRKVFDVGPESFFENLGRGWLYSILTHVISSFVAFGLTGGCYPHRSGLSIDFSPVIIPYEAGKSDYF